MKENEFTFKSSDPDLRHLSIRVQVDVMEHEVYEAKITGVTDGDTLRVRLSSLGVPDRVRLLGIDAPETGTGERAERQCEKLGVDIDELHILARISTIHLQWLCPKGAKATLRTTEKARDDSGRILAGVFIGDLCVNKSMVERGFALVYQGMSDWESYQDQELKARDALMGIWGTCEEQFYLASSRTYHRPGCTSTRYAQRRFQTIKEAKAAGLSPCSTCMPDYAR